MICPNEKYDCYWYRQTKGCLYPTLKDGTACYDRSAEAQCYTKIDKVETMHAGEERSCDNCYNKLARFEDQWAALNCNGCVRRATDNWRPMQKRQCPKGVYENQPKMVCIICGDKCPFNFRPEDLKAIIERDGEKKKCPECGHEMREGDEVWWCMNPECDVRELKKSLASKKSCKSCKHNPICFSTMGPPEG